MAGTGSKRTWTRISTLLALFALWGLGALPAEAVKRRAFVTSVSGNGDLGSWPDAGSATGLAAGNAICRARATAAALPNATTYRAWLSTETTDAYCHLRGQTGEKFSCVGGSPLAAGPWYLVNGITNFTGTLDELVSNNPKIFRPVLLDEFGDDLPEAIEDRTYWTGTGTDGKQFNGGPFHCSGWTSGVDGSSAPRGDGLGTAATWTLGGFMPSCSTAMRLLCFEPGASETTTLRWSAGSPVFITSAFGSGDLSSWPVRPARAGSRPAMRSARRRRGSASARSGFVRSLAFDIEPRRPGPRDFGRSVSPPRRLHRGGRQGRPDRRLARHEPSRRRAR